MTLIDVTVNGCGQRCVFSLRFKIHPTVPQLNPKSSAFEQQTKGSSLFRDVHIDCISYKLVGRSCCTYHRMVSHDSIILQLF